MIPTILRPAHSHRIIIAVILAGAPGLLGGCARAYKTPGGAANLSIFVDRDIQEEFDRAPAGELPAQLAVARVQAPHYWSQSAKGYGEGRYSVVTVRDAGEDAGIEKLRNLPDIAQIGWLNRLLLDNQLNSERQLRVAAASLHADLLLVYTFDTHFYVGDALSPLTVVTLGLSPSKDVHVTTTVSALLLDVRTGYIYGTCEGSARQDRLASAWTSKDAVDRSRRATEQQAFEKLVQEFEGLWPRVREQLR